MSSPDNLAVTPKRKVTLGHIISAFGVKGWVEVISFTQNPVDLFNYSPWHLKHSHRSLKLSEVHVMSFKPHKQKALHSTWVVQLKESADRDQALGLRGADIEVPRQQLPHLPIHQYYWTDLEGLEVYNLQNQYLGKIDYLFDTGANDVIVIKGTTILYIPYILDKVIKEISLEKKFMKIDWEIEK